MSCETWQIVCPFFNGVNWYSLQTCTDLRVLQDLTISALWKLGSDIKTSMDPMRPPVNLLS